MANINSFLGTVKKGRSKVERYEEQTKGKSAEVQREVEMELLVPEEIPKYTGPKPTEASKAPNKSKAIKFGFKTTPEVELVKKYFRVNQYVEQNVSEASLLITLLQLIEDGKLTYDKKTNIVSLVK